MSTTVDPYLGKLRKKDSTTQTGTTSPVGVVTPSVVGSFFVDTSTDPYTIYVSYGLTSNDWGVLQHGINE